MSDEKKASKETAKSETKKDDRASETVHLTPQELRKISGGALTKPTPGTPKP